MHGEVRWLQAERFAGARRDRFIPGQAFADHHRFAREEDRRSLEIHRFIHASDAIAVRIERVGDVAAADGHVTGTRGHERPSKPRVHLTPRLFIREEPFGRLHLLVLERELAGAEREQDSRDDRRREHRLALHEAPGAPADRCDQPRAEDGESHAHGGFDQHEPRARQEKRREEVTIEPALVRADGDCEARHTERGDDKLSNETRNRAFGLLDARNVRSDVSQMTPTLCYPAPLRWRRPER